MTKSIRRNHTSAFTATVGRIDLRDEQTRRLERIAELLYSGAMPFETASTVDSAPPYARSGELTPETILSGGARSMASTSQAGDRRSPSTPSGGRGPPSSRACTPRRCR